MAINYDKFIYKNSGSPFIDQLNAVKAGYEKRLATETAQLGQKEQQAIADSNKTYDANARQNYINYMQSRKALPSQLNALGVRGGASESSLLRLGTTYGQNVASNEAARGTAQDALRQTYAEQIQNLRNDYAQRIIDAEANARAKQLEWEDNQKKQDVQYFSQAITGAYKTKEGYEKLIEKLKASNDPNKDVKIMLARQAMNQLKDEGSSGSGGGGRRSGGRRGYGGGSGSGYGDDYSGSGGDVNTSSIEKAMKATVKGAKKAKKKQTNSRSSAISSRMRRARSRAYSKPSRRRIWR